MLVRSKLPAMVTTLDSLVLMVRWLGLFLCSIVLFVLVVECAIVVVRKII